MPSARLEFGREWDEYFKPVFDTFDIWGKEFDLPELSTIYLPLQTDDFVATKSVNPENPGYHFSIPICVLGCLSYSELRFMFGWTFNVPKAVHRGSSAAESLQIAFNFHSKDYTPIQMFSTHLKCQAMRFLWADYQLTSTYADSLERQQTRILEVLDCDSWGAGLKKAISLTAREHPFIRQLAPNLSEFERASAGKLAETISKNQVFDLNDYRLFSRMLEAFEYERRILKKAAA